MARENKGMQSAKDAKNDEFCADFMISVVDTVDGKVKYCRRFYFNPEFSSSFRTVASLLCNQKFDREQYDELLNLVQQQYSTEEIACAAMAECRL